MRMQAREFTTTWSVFTLRSLILFFVLSLVLIPGQVSGQASGQASGQGNLFPPKGPLPRYLENYAAFDSIGDKSTYQRIKYIPLGSKSYLSLGGGIRYRYEFFDDCRFGIPEQDGNGYLLDRYMLHADYQHKRFRLFTQFRSSNVYARGPGPRALDRDLFDVNQFFLEVPFKLLNTKASILLGRREIFYGASRWITFRDGPNSRLSFDGLTLAIKGKLEVDVFQIFPVKIGTSAFDNLPDFDRSISGLHLAYKNWIPGNEMNVYGLYHSPAGEVAARRVSLGVRNVTRTEGVKIDLESIFQLANSQDVVLKAYSVGFDLEYRVLKNSERLKLGFFSLYNSGNSQTGAMTYYTIHPAYYNVRDISLFGKYNLFYLQPYIDLSVLGKDKLLIESILYWKSNLADNVYTPPGTVLLSPQDFNARYLGLQLNLIYRYYWNPFFQSEIGYRAFRTSGQLASQTDFQNVHFLSVACTFRF